MKRFSIRHRLMILMICLTTLPVLTVTWIAAMNTRDSVQTEIVNANISRMLWAEQYVSEMIGQLKTVFISIQINPQIMSMMEKTGYRNSDVHFRSQNDIRTILTSHLYSNSQRFEQLTLYMHARETAYSVDFSGSGTMFSMTVDERNWQRMKQQPIPLYFEPADDGIYAYHSINQFEDQQLLGGIAARIDDEVWQQVSEILLSEQESSVYVVNDAATLLTLAGMSEGHLPADILDTAKHMNTFESKPRVISNDQYFYFMKAVGGGRLTIIKVIPIEAIQSSANSTIRAGIVTGMVFAIASLLLSVLVSLRISRPIVALAKKMRMADPNHLAYTAVNTRDEIGLLEKGYNSLVQRIKILIEHEFQRELDVKNAQLAALQAQINPHFLNNTLHMIGGMALAKDVPEIYRVTKVIGELLRYSISSGEELVTLEEETKHMNNYLYIQQQRFTGRCQVHISNDYQGAEIRLPKFSLQPLVENAFEHGLQKQEGQWQLDIRLVQARSRMLILIRDYGVGMTTERLQQIRSELLGQASHPLPSVEHDDSKRRKGIGLKNVDARLRLLFGSRYRLRVFSQLGEGTLIVAALPAPLRERR